MCAQDRSRRRPSDLAGVAAVEHVQCRMTGRAAQHAADDLGAEARAAHAEQHDVPDIPAPRQRTRSALPYPRRHRRPPPTSRASVPRCSPATMPHRPSTAARTSAGLVPVQACPRPVLQRLGQARFEPVDLVAQHFGARSRDRADQRIGGIRKFVDAFDDQNGGHAREIEAQAFRLGQDPAFAVDIRGER